MRYVGPRHYHIDNPPAVPVPWLPDRRFEGETVAIIGGGPSHVAVSLDTIRGYPFIAVNSSSRRVQPVATGRDMLYFSDDAWSQRYGALITAWPGPVVTTNSRTKARLSDAVRYLDPFTLPSTLGVMADHAQASSGHIAACLAVLMGAAGLVLVGFECREVAGRTHGHDDYRQHDMAAFEERYLPGWRALARAFGERGVTVFNASPGSAIDVFPIVDLARS